MTKVSGEGPHVAGGYRPHLDGLRMLAVYLVVLFHAGSARFSGGFIGVDAFFVLSGYLVTQLLVRDLTASGGVAFGRFYARRIRRLLPASLAVLVVTAVVYSSLASPADIDAAQGAFRASLLYVANWFFIDQAADYFAAATDRNPVIHFWSLAIEEQFYLVWPVLLAGLFAVTRRLGAAAHRARQGLVGLAAAASLVWALHLAGSDVARAYYGTDARAYQLLAGALVALTPGAVLRARRSRGVAHAAAAAAVLVLALLSTSLVDLGAVGRGAWATLAVVVLLVALEAAADGPLARALSTGPVTYLGRISYGTYLWHWPVVVFALLLTDGTISATSLFAVAALVATGLASLSYAVLEMPVRQHRSLDRANAAVIVTGLGAGLLVVALVVPRVLDPYRDDVLVAAGSTPTGGVEIEGLDLEAARTEPDPRVADVPFLPTWSCVGQPSEACTIVRGSGQHLLVVGDSSAWGLFPAFAVMAQRRGLTLSTAAAAGCPWQQRVQFTEAARAGCARFKDDLYERVVRDLRPDVVVVASRNYFDPEGRSPSEVLDARGRAIRPRSTGDFRRLFVAESERSLEALTRWGARVVLVEPVPAAPPGEDPFACLGAAERAEECRFVVEPAEQVDEVYRGLAAGRDVFVADLDPLVCPDLPICDPFVNGQLVRFDREHLTPRFAASLADPIEALLRDAGVVAG